MIKLYNIYNDSIYLEKNFLSKYIAMYINDSSFSKYLIDVLINDSNLENKNDVIVTIKFSDKINANYDKLEHLYFEIKYLLKSIFSIDQPKINFIVG